MSGETIRDVVIRVAIESAAPQMTAPDTTPVAEALDALRQQQQDTVNQTAQAMADSMVQATAQAMTTAQEYGELLRRNEEAQKALWEQMYAPIKQIEQERQQASEQRVVTAKAEAEALSRAFDEADKLFNVKGQKLPDSAPTATALATGVDIAGADSAFAGLDELKKGFKQAQDDLDKLIKSQAELDESAGSQTGFAVWLDSVIQGTASAEEMAQGLIASLDGLDEAQKRVMLSQWAQTFEKKIDQAGDRALNQFQAMTSSAIRFTRGLTLMAASGDEEIGKLIKIFIGFQSVLDVVDGGINMVQSASKGLSSLESMLEGMAVAQGLAAESSSILASAESVASAATAALSTATTVEAAAAAAAAPANVGLASSFGFVTAAANQAALATVRFTAALLTNPAFLAFAAVIGTIAAIMAMMKLPEEDFSEDAENMRLRLQEIEDQAAATRRALDIKSAGLMGTQAEAGAISTALVQLSQDAAGAKASMEGLRGVDLTKFENQTVASGGETLVDSTTDSGLALAEQLVARNEARVDLARSELDLRYELLSTTERQHAEAVRGTEAQIDALEAQREAVDLAERQVLAQGQAVEHAKRQLELAEARITSEDAALGRLSAGEFAQLEFIKKRLEAGKELTEQQLALLDRSGAEGREIAERQRAATGAERRGEDGSFFGATLAPKTAADLDKGIDDATTGVADAQRREADAKQRLAEAQDNLATGLSLVGSTEELTKKLEELNKAWVEQRADQVAAIQATVATVKAMSEDLKESQQELERIKNEHARFAQNQ